MYLQQLYQHSRPWFLVIIFFIAGQLFINYKRGVVCTPFFHYGMYSEVITPAAQYTVPEVYINGERLATKDFTPQQWDNIMQPIIKFQQQKEGNQQLFATDIQRMMPFADQSKFINNISEAQFNTWYRQQLEKITGKTIHALKIAYQDYLFNGTNLSKANPLIIY